MNNLTQEAQGIMSFKRSSHHQRMLDNGIHKAFYVAVLDDEVQSVDEFNRYLLETDYVAQRLMERTFIYPFAQV